VPCPAIDAVPPENPEPLKVIVFDVKTVEVDVLFDTSVNVN